MNPSFAGPTARYLISQHFVHYLKQVNGLKTREGKTFRNLNLRHSNESKFAKKKWISSHRAPITVPQAQSPVLSAEQEVSIVSKAIFAIIAFKLAIAWSASFVSYPARLDPAC